MSNHRTRQRFNRRLSRYQFILDSILREHGTALGLLYDPIVADHLVDARRALESAIDAAAAHGPLPGDAR